MEMQGVNYKRNKTALRIETDTDWLCLFYQLN